MGLVLLMLKYLIPADFHWRDTNVSEFLISWIRVIVWV